MSQDYSTSVSGTLAPILTSRLPANDEALRTFFSGDTEPANPIAYMEWKQGSTGITWVRDASNATWKAARPATGNAGRLITKVDLGTVNASANTRVLMLPCTATIIRVGLWSSTTSTGSAGGTTEYRWQFRNLTASLNLFSANVGTGTVLGPVGGGEITADTPYWLTADQNQNAAAGDRFEFEVTKIGSPTSLTTVTLFLDYYERG